MFADSRGSLQRARCRSSDLAHAAAVTRYGLRVYRAQSLKFIVSRFSVGSSTAKSNGDSSNMEVDFREDFFISSGLEAVTLDNGRRS